MHNIKINFDIINHVINDILNKEVNAKGNTTSCGVVPKSLDVEVMALSFTAECSSNDSENY